MTRHFSLTANDSSHSIDALLKENKKIMHNRIKLFSYYLDGQQGLDKLVAHHVGMHHLLADVMSLKETDTLSQSTIEIIEKYYSEKPMAKKFGFSALPKAVAGAIIENPDIINDLDFDLRPLRHFPDKDRNLSKLQERLNSDGQGKTSSSDIAEEDCNLSSINLEPLELSPDKLKTLMSFQDLSTREDKSPLDKLKMILLGFFKSEAKMAEISIEKFNAIFIWIKRAANFPLIGKPVETYFQEIGAFYKSIGMNGLSYFWLIFIPQMQQLEKTPVLSYS